jgi:hypothetical protein
MGSPIGRFRLRFGARQKAEYSYSAASSPQEHALK